MSDDYPNKQNGWNEYSKLVLAELERLSAGVDGLKADIQNLKVEIVVLKTKASVWGGLAGLVPGLILYFFGRN